MLKFIAFAFSIGALFAQTEPSAGQWRTWVIPSGISMRLPPPPQGESVPQTQPNLATIAYWDAGPPSYRWMQLALQFVTKANLPTPLATRALALTAAAINDATIAAWDTKYAYRRAHPSAQALVAIPASPSYPSEHAVTAAAAASVLAYVLPDQAAALTKLASDAASSRVMAGVAFPSDASAGLDLGKRVGDAVVAFARTDSSDQVFTGSYPASPGKWGSANPVSPLAPSWRPWVLSTAGDLRLDPPPAAGSPEAAAQYAAVKNLARTNATNHSAWFWQPSFFGPWLQTVDQKIFENHLESNAPRAARAYALETIAQHDATLACWDTKYFYLEPRPSQADSTITTLFANPQHPGYPSGHACASGASAAVMSFLFPADQQVFTDMAQDAGTSTFDAGIHTPVDVSQGLVLGRGVGQKVVTRAQTDGAN